MGQLNANHQWIRTITVADDPEDRGDSDVTSCLLRSVIVAAERLRHEKKETWTEHTKVRTAFLCEGRRFNLRWRSVHVYFRFFLQQKIQESTPDIQVIYYFRKDKVSAATKIHEICAILDFTPPSAIVHNRRFGTIYRFHFKCQAVQELLDFFRWDR